VAALLLRLELVSFAPADVIYSKGDEAEKMCDSLWAVRVPGVRKCCEWRPQGMHYRAQMRCYRLQGRGGWAMRVVQYSGCLGLPGI
jgi:hypothetical protein